MESIETDITIIISDEIKSKSLDLAIDFSEIAVDEFIKTNILTEIPIVKSVVAFYNVSKSVVDRHKVKKILTFFQEFNRGQIDDLKYNQFMQKFNSDESYKNQVVETILLLNERFLQVEKSKILANLIIAHINEDLSWKDLIDVSIVLDSIHPKGFFLLKIMADEPHWSSQIISNNPDEALLIACGIANRSGTKFSVVELGQQLYNFGLKPSGF